MMKYTRTARLIAQSRYLMDHKKAPTEIPSSKPAKYVYQTSYHPSARPGIDIGYPDHFHQNLFLQEAGNRHENFRYSYQGEWWQGYFIPKLLMIFAPFFIFLGIVYQDDNWSRKKPNFQRSLIMDSLPYNFPFVPKQV